MEAFYSQRRLRTGAQGVAATLHGGSIDSNAGPGFEVAPASNGDAVQSAVHSLEIFGGRRQRAREPHANYESTKPGSPGETRQSPITLFASPRRYRGGEGPPPEHMNDVFSDNTGKAFPQELFGSSREGKKNHNLGVQVMGSVPEPSRSPRLLKTTSAAGKFSLHQVSSSALARNSQPKSLGVRWDGTNGSAPGPSTSPRGLGTVPGSKPGSVEDSARMHVFGSHRRIRSGSPRERTRESDDVKWPWDTQGKVDQLAQHAVFGTQRPLAHRPLSPRREPVAAAGRVPPPEYGIFHSTDKPGKAKGLMWTSQMKVVLRSPQ